MVTVEVPDIGDFTDVPVIELHVSPGDTVALDDPLVTLESDKATMDVPAPFAGEVRELLVKVGDRVAQGAALLTLETADTPAAAAVASGDVERAPVTAQVVEQAAEIAPREGAPAAPPPPPPPRDSNGHREHIYASPAVRRLARERGIDLHDVPGTGRKGRITRADVEGFTEAPAGARPEPLPTGAVEAGKFGPVERVQRSRIQKISAPRLAQNWATIPHVTHNDEADITELEAWRKQLNSEQSEAKVTMVSFLVVACVAVLKEFPAFNSSLDGEELLLKRYYNIGFAADTPGGLVVPVIKDADRLGLLEIASELTRLSGKARDGKLAPGDMQGATFTISSLGGIGGTSFTPIINAPEVAILGVTRAAMKPVWDGSAFVPRLMVPLSLSYDHRVIDGAAAARFMVALVRVLSDLRRALL